MLALSSALPQRRRLCIGVHLPSLGHKHHAAVSHDILKTLQQGNTPLLGQLLECSSMLWGIVCTLPAVVTHHSCEVCLCRERASKMYARASYITAVGFVELPYIVAQTIVFVPVAYFMVGEPCHC